MGGVSAGSDAFFSVSPAGPGEAGCFVIRYGDADARFDPHFHKPLFRNLMQNLKNAGGEAIGSLAIYSGEIWDKSDGRFSDVFPYIEISGVSLGTNEYEVESVRIDESPSRARQVVRYGDILISLTRPHRGAVAIVQPEQDGAIASTGFAVIREIDSDKITRDYLLHCLTASFSTDQMLMRSSGGSYPAITRDELAKILIPKIPLDSQIRLVAAMDAARNERKAKLDEAEALLAGIDDYLLDALGIAPPAAETRRVFAISLGQTQSSGRIDSDYYHPERTRALRILDTVPSDLVVARLADVVSFERDQIDAPGANYLGMAQVSSHTGELTGATDTASGKCLVFQPDDVLFSRMAPALNKVYCAEMDGCCTTEFQVLRVKNRDALLPEYLAAILRSRIILSQTVHMTTGSTRPRLSNDDVANLTVPAPGLAVQGIIAAEIRRRRDDARRLRDEASAGWQAAKGWFEGEALPAGQLGS